MVASFITIAEQPPDAVIALRPRLVAKEILDMELAGLHHMKVSTSPTVASSLTLAPSFKLEYSYLLSSRRFELSPYYRYLHSLWW